MFKVSGIYRILLCFTCHANLCTQCSEKHARDQETKDHNVVKDRHHSYCFVKQMQCARHLYSCQDVAENSIPCELPVFFQCQKIESYGKVDCAACETKRQQLKRTCRIIREKEHICTSFYLRNIKQDVKNCQKMCSSYKEKMLGKARKLMKSIDLMTYNVDFKHRCSKQKKEVNIHIIRLHEYEKNVRAISNHSSALSLVHKENHTSPKAYDRALQPYLFN